MGNFLFSVLFLLLLSFVGPGEEVRVLVLVWFLILFEPFSFFLNVVTDTSTLPSSIYLPRLFSSTLFVLFRGFFLYFYSCSNGMKCFSVGECIPT